MVCTGILQTTCDRAPSPTPIRDHHQTTMHTKHRHTYTHTDKTTDAHRHTYTQRSIPIKLLQTRTHTHTDTTQSRDRKPTPRQTCFTFVGLLHSYTGNHAPARISEQTRMNACQRRRADAHTTRNHRPVQGDKRCEIRGWRKPSVLPLRVEVGQQQLLTSLPSKNRARLLRRGVESSAYGCATR